MQFHINSPDINNEKAVLLARDETLGNCLNLTEIIPQASVRYDVNEQRLDIDVPQAWVMKNYQNYVDPSLWENGINAAMLSYNLNGYHSETPGRRNDSIYAAFNGGMNLGAWRLRASGNYNWMTDSGSNYDLRIGIYSVISPRCVLNSFLVSLIQRAKPLILSVSAAFVYTATAACCLRH